MYTWHSSLPKRSVLNGYSEEIEDDVVAFPTEYGRPKARRRSAYSPDRRSIPFKMTDAQRAQFKSDWRAYINGVSSFQGPDFSTGTGTVTYDPVPGSRPKIVPTGRQHWHVSIEVRVTP